MTTENQVDDSDERGRRVDQLWSAIEMDLENYEREKQAFESEHGFTFEKFVETMACRARTQFENGDAETRAKLESAKEQMELELQKDFMAAEAAQQVQYGKSGTGPNIRMLRTRV